MKVRTAVLIGVALTLGGCASLSSGSAVVMPTPGRDDIEGQIMSTTGDGFTICDVGDASSDGNDYYDVIVCGSVDRARAAITAQHPQLAEITKLRGYQPDDGGPHTPQELVMQFWINRTTGAGFTITSSQIMDDGTIDVGIAGDLKAGTAALDKEFPGRTTVHEQAPGTELVGTLPSPAG